VTDARIIGHWRKGAKDALRVAKLAAEDGAYELALFHCHLAVEKALKAAVMEKTGKPHPKVHNLSRLALLVREDWSDQDRELFTTLSEFAVAARYDDPTWADRYATAENARLWIERTDAFLSDSHP
jgi:HEPN domain-containing protein